MVLLFPAGITIVTCDQSVPVTVLSAYEVVKIVAVVVDGDSDEGRDEVVDGTTDDVVTVVAVVATTLVMDVSGPTEEEGTAELFGVTVVDKVGDKVLYVDPAPFVVVSVMTVLTTMVANWLQ